MEALFGQVRNMAATAEESTRKKIIDGLRNLATSLESSNDTMERIMFLHLQLAVIRVGIDLRIFNMLCASEVPLGLIRLSHETGADPLLLGRLMRYLCSIDVIQETDVDLFAATNVTQALANPENQAGVYHYFDHLGKQYQELPNFLAKTKYQNPTCNTRTVFQDAWKTDEPLFAWYPEHQPETYTYFNRHMAARRDNMPTWLSIYPLDDETRGRSPDAPLFVDVGGGIGQQCAALKAKYPDLPGYVVLEDLPHCINEAISTPGVQNVAHDFFEPQPIHGAKYYHMRGVLHDFPDDQCRQILQQIMPAMGEDSLILIEDMVLPIKGVHWQAAQVDITMMCGLAAMERTEAQWHALLDSVGLEISKIYVVIPETHESVIVAGRRLEEVASSA